jgi:hypothetical protein
MQSTYATSSAIRNGSIRFSNGMPSASSRAFLVRFANIPNVSMQETDMQV